MFLVTNTGFTVFSVVHQHKHFIRRVDTVWNKNGFNNICTTCNKADTKADLISMFVSQVEILSGKDQGKQGKVIQVLRCRNWVVVEGLNTVRTDVVYL